jgi:hypothetical protein
MGDVFKTVSYDEMCQTIWDACDSVMGLELSVYDGLPKGPDLPALCLKPDDQSAISNYHVAFCSTSARYNLIAMVFVGQVVELEAVKRIREIISPGSALITALEDITFNGSGWVMAQKAGVGETALATGRCKFGRIPLLIQT